MSGYGVFHVTAQQRGTEGTWRPELSVFGIFRIENMFLSIFGRGAVEDETVPAHCVADMKRTGLTLYVSTGHG